MLGDTSYSYFDSNTNWQCKRSIQTATATSLGQISIQDNSNSGWDEIKVRNVNLIDLTLMFGAGNEPSTVEEFEALFPEAYYPYNAGELISNDAEAVESVGFNI